MTASLAKRAGCEALGTGLLTATVIGSGIMAEQMGGNAAITLLANTIATAAVLVALILVFAPLSGAHFNPAVSLSMAIMGPMAARDLAAYIAAQTAGAIVGAVLAHAMFALPLISVSVHSRSGIPLLIGEFVATFGLLIVIGGCSGSSCSTPGIAIAVGAYIAAAYWFTSSTSFANPALTVARSLTNTFAGIRPANVPGFIAAQFLGALAGTWLSVRLVPSPHAPIGSPKT